MTKTAVLLAGGKGTRLRPYTVVLPKPLMPIGEYPILEVVIRQLTACGFGRIIIAVNHQAELIKAFFGSGSKWNVAIEYSLEDQPLGTIGPLRLIGDLPADFLVMNGDILTDLDYGNFFRAHTESAHEFTISSYERENRIDYGVLDTDHRGHLVAFREKPVEQYEVSMGIYMMSRTVLRYIPQFGPYGFDELMQDMLRASQPVAVRRFHGYWLDIGRTDDYARAIEEFNDMKDRFIRG